MVRQQSLLADGFQVGDWSAKNEEGLVKLSQQKRSVWQRLFG